MGIIGGGKQLDVRTCVTLKRLMTNVGDIDWFLVTVRRDVLRHLGTGHSRDLQKVTSQDSFLRPQQCQVLEPNQRRTDPLGTVLFAKRLERDWERPFYEHLKIADGVKQRIIEHGDHGERMKLSRSLRLIFGEKEVMCSGLSSVRED